MTIRESLPRALTLAVFLALAASPVAASPILPAHSMWEYTFVDPTADPTWTTTGIGAGGWAFGLAPFGNHTGGFPTDPGQFFDYNTYWPSDGPDGDDLWVRTTIDLTGYDPRSARWNMGVDNGFALYVNGMFIAWDNAEQYTSQWEYSGTLGRALHDGMNTIAVALEDHGDLTAFDMEVTADPQPIPEPGSALLLLTGGLMALGAARRRWR